MIIFTLRRLLLLLITLFLLTFVGFSLSYFTPHAPLQGASLWNAWLFWFEGVLHWDFGVSSINGQLISEQLKEVFPATMELCILAFGFALVIGIPVGMLAGIMRNKWQDTLISALALLGFSIPVFWLALLLTLFFSLTLGWFPVSGRFDLLYEVKSVTGFALIDAWLSDSPWRHEISSPAFSSTLRVSFCSTLLYIATSFGFSTMRIELFLLLTATDPVNKVVFTSGLSG